MGWTVSEGLGRSRRQSGQLCLVNPVTLVNLVQNQPAGQRDLQVVFRGMELKHEVSAEEMETVIAGRIVGSDCLDCRGVDLLVLVGSC